MSNSSRLIGLDNLSGPITIAKVIGQIAEMGWQTFISFMALMSVSFRNSKFIANSNVRWRAFSLFLYRAEFVENLFLNKDPIELV